MSCVIELGPDGAVRLPEEFRARLGLKEGSLVKVIQREDYVILMPVRNLMELFGIDACHKEELLKAIRELEEERREAARR